ncbi:MAG: amino acid-binding protein [Propionibacteriaceae bacterium]
MLLLRLALPNRPGSLGAIATAMGTCGANIYAVEFIDYEVDRCIGDFMLDLPAATMADSLVSVCEAIDGCRVIWLSHYPENWGLESDIELLTRLTDDPEHAAEILTAAAPTVFHCHWALLTDGKIALAQTTLAPDYSVPLLDQLGPLDQIHHVDLAQGWLPDWGEATCVVAPLSQGRTIVVGRQAGPAWLPSEIARLKFLAGMTP